MLYRVNGGHRSAIRLPQTNGLKYAIGNSKGVLGRRARNPATNVEEPDDDAAKVYVLDKSSHVNEQDDCANSDYPPPHLRTTIPSSDAAARNFFLTNSFSAIQSSKIAHASRVWVHWRCCTACGCERLKVVRTYRDKVMSSDNKATNSATTLLSVAM